MVYYKFRNLLAHGIIPLDDLYISVGDVKKYIIKKCKISDDLRLLNDDTKKEYKDDKELIRRCTRVIAMRIPSTKKKIKSFNDTRQHQVKEQETTKTFENFANNNLSEQERIQMMMKQSALASYGLVHSQRELPPWYVCRSCGKPGHWIQYCPRKKFGEKKEKILVPKGIPKSFLIKVDDPSKKAGAMRLSDGTWVRTVIAHKVYKEEMNEKLCKTPKDLNTSEVATKTPEELICKICSDILDDPHQSKCCFSSACYDCFMKHICQYDQCYFCYKEKFTGADIILNLKLKEVVHIYKNPGLLLPSPSTLSDITNSKIKSEETADLLKNVKKEEFSESGAPQGVAISVANYNKPSIYPIKNELKSEKKSYYKQRKNQQWENVPQSRDYKWNQQMDFYGNSPYYARPHPYSKKRSNYKNKSYCNNQNIIHLV